MQFLPSYFAKWLVWFFSPQGILLRTFKFLELDKLEKMENILYLS